jgi:hypothetical protein
MNPFPPKPRQVSRVSHGMARPENPNFQTGLKRMLDFLDVADIPEF